jgi:hypothetical protein
MKTNRLFVVLVLVMVASFIISGTAMAANSISYFNGTKASAKSSRIDFTGSEWCDPETMFFDKVWLAGPNAHIGQLTQVCYDTASIPQLIGTDYLSGANVHFVGGGKIFIMTGKLRMVSVEGGAWVGSWVLPANTTTIRVVAHGEGLYEGMVLHWFLSLDGPFWGYILTSGD